jgi:NhaP-type Na+/H+ or K+/H+ antiporter
MSIAQRMHLPRLIVNILEGKAWVNMPRASYRMAITAVVTGTSSLRTALVEFLFTAIVGVAIGLVTAVINVRNRG